MIYRYIFQDMWTNEVFPVESSFGTEVQALYRSPKFLLARLEFGMGFGSNPELGRFRFVELQPTPPAKEE